MDAWWERRTVCWEVVERGQVSAVGEARRRLAQLVEEDVRARLEGRDAARRRVLEQPTHQLDRLDRRPRTEDLKAAHDDATSACDGKRRNARHVPPRRLSLDRVWSYGKTHFFFKYTLFFHRTIWTAVILQSTTKFNKINTENCTIQAKTF